MHTHSLLRLCTRRLCNARRRFVCLSVCLQLFVKELLWCEQDQICQTKTYLSDLQDQRPRPRVARCYCPALRNLVGQMGNSILTKSWDLLEVLANLKRVAQCSCPSSHGPRNGRIINTYAWIIRESCNLAESLRAHCITMLNLHFAAGGLMQLWPVGCKLAITP